MADPGEGPGAPPPPSPLFLDQTETRKAVKIFVCDWASPLIWGSGGLDPPLPVTSSTTYSELAGSYGIQLKIWKEVFLSFLFLCFAFSFWYDWQRCMTCVIAYLLRFNFILDSNFIFICFTLFIIHHCTEKKTYDLSQGLNKPQHIFLRESHRFTRDLPYKHFETHRKLSTSNFRIQLDFWQILTKHVGFNSFLLFFHFSSHWFRWWFLKKFSYAKEKTMKDNFSFTS